MTAPKTGTWPGFVARVATPATPEDTCGLIVDAWPAVVGVEVTYGELVAVLAQVMVETATREDPNHDGVTTADEQAAGYWNGNAGNIRGTFNGWWTSFRAGEGYGPNEVILEPGPNNRFRSYLRPDDDVTDPKVLGRARELGLRDMIGLLVRRYSLALEHAANRDFAGYVRALRIGGWFTAAETAYLNAEDRLRHTIEYLPQAAAFVEEPVMAMRRST